MRLDLTQAMLFLCLAVCKVPEIVYKAGLSRFKSIDLNHDLNHDLNQVIFLKKSLI